MTDLDDLPVGTELVMQEPETKTYWLVRHTSPGEWTVLHQITEERAQWLKLVFGK